MATAERRTDAPAMTTGLDPHAPSHYVKLPVSTVAYALLQLVSITTFVSVLQTWAALIVPFLIATPHARVRRVFVL